MKLIRQINWVNTSKNKTKHTWPNRTKKCSTDHKNTESFKTFQQKKKKIVVKKCPKYLRKNPTKYIRKHQNHSNTLFSSEQKLSYLFSIGLTVILIVIFHTIIYSSFSIKNKYFLLFWYFLDDTKKEKCLELNVNFAFSH